MEDHQIVTASPSLEQNSILHNEQSTAKVQPITHAVIQWQTPQLESPVVEMMPKV